MPYTNPEDEKAEWQALMILAGFGLLMAFVAGALIYAAL
jgi:hypothetical protein